MSKKTERQYTPLSSMLEFSQKIEDRGDRLLYRYYDCNKTLCEMTYGEFGKMIRTETAGLAKLGLYGKRIAIIGETSPEWVSTYIAGIAAGNVMIPMDRELQVEEIENFFTRAEADAVVYAPSFHEKFAHAIAEHPTVKHFIPMPSKTPIERDGDKIVPFGDLLQMGTLYLADGYCPPAVRDPNALTVLLFTSGTTGSSKCVMLSEQNVLAAINSACECAEFYPDDVIVSVLPIHHTYELCCQLAAINYGGTVCINDSLKHVIRNFALFRPTILVLVPLFVTTMYKKIWEEARKSGKEKLLSAAIRLTGGLGHLGIDISGKLFRDVLAAFGGRLTRIVCGGAPLNPEIVKKFAAFNIRIHEGYGITECSPLVSQNPYYALKSGSVGPTVVCCEARIDEESEDERGHKIGEIQVRGSNVMLGYYKDEEATRAVFTDDGFFRTGDVGYMDKDGYIFITGRKKSVIVLENGKNVFPEEIEEYLERIDSVEESVVVGRKAEDGDSITLTAVIYPAYEKLGEGKDQAEVEKIIKNDINQLNRKLPSFKQIRAVEIRMVPFEKTTSRKIKRHLVK